VLLSGLAACMAFWELTCLLYRNYCSIEVPGFTHCLSKEESRQHQAEGRLAGMPHQPHHPKASFFNHTTGCSRQL